MPAIISRVHENFVYFGEVSHDFIDDELKWIGFGKEVVPDE